MPMDIYDDQTELVQAEWQRTREREHARGILYLLMAVFVSSAITLGIIAWALTAGS